MIYHKDIKKNVKINTMKKHVNKDFQQKRNCKCSSRSRIY